MADNSRDKRALRTDSTAVGSGQVVDELHAISLPDTEGPGRHHQVRVVNKMYVQHPENEFGRSHRLAEQNFMQLLPRDFLLTRIAPGNDPHDTLRRPKKGYGMLRCSGPSAYMPKPVAAGRARYL